MCSENACASLTRTAWAPVPRDAAGFKSYDGLSRFSLGATAHNTEILKRMLTVRYVFGGP